MEILQELFKVAPVVGVMGYFIWLRNKEIKDYKEDNKQLVEDFKSMTENAIKIITLTEDRLDKTQSQGKEITEIKTIVKDIKDLLQKRQ